MATFSIAIKSYPPEAKALVDIWERYARSGMNSHGIEFLTFVNKRPKNPRSNNRRIAGLPAQSISYLKDDTELVKMSVENFIYLMAKVGVLLEIKEEGDGCRKCYDCDNYQTSYFCGYNQSLCKIHGSLDMDQTARHPDTTAATCGEFKQKGGATR